MACIDMDDDLKILIEAIESNGCTVDSLMHAHIWKISYRLDSAAVNKSFDPTVTPRPRPRGPKVPRPSGPIKRNGGIVSNEPDFDVVPLELSYGNACKHCHTETESLFHFFTKKRCNHCGRSL